MFKKIIKNGLNFRTERERFRKHCCLSAAKVLFSPQCPTLIQKLRKTPHHTKHLQAAHLHKR